MKDLEVMKMGLLPQSGLKQLNILSFRKASKLCFVVLILIMRMALIWLLTLTGKTKGETLPVSQLITELPLTLME